MSQVYPEHEKFSKISDKSQSIGEVSGLVRAEEEEDAGTDQEGKMSPSAIHGWIGPKVIVPVFLQSGLSLATALDVTGSFAQQNDCIVQFTWSGALFQVWYDTSPGYFHDPDRWRAVRIVDSQVTPVPRDKGRWGSFQETR